MQVVAVNGLSHKVSVVQKDIALLERGHEVRYLGCNLAIADLFDAGTPKYHFLPAQSILSKILYAQSLQKSSNCYQYLTAMQSAGMRSVLLLTSIANVRCMHLLQPEPLATCSRHSCKEALSLYACCLC